MLASLCSAPATAGEAASVSAQDALSRLVEGNKRFVRGESIHPHASADYRASLAHEQHPFATVLACSDSRVTPVLIFDQGVGDLFVIRVAGNVVDDDVTGSIEYAVDHLGCPLVLVMGHKSCGAVTAAHHAFVAHDLQEEPQEILSLLARIAPAMRGLDRNKPTEGQVDEAIEKNVRIAIQRLSACHDLHESLEAGKLQIRGAVYDLETGAVHLLGD
ncbi:carbonic anhydrase [Pseudobythopirellula maris]|uniref:carbonic anhydrase n=1 Tax=Pseudobythopirellula maris TaxID=2527991 RepID=UPI0018D305E5|nr:carbonic anhydrase [Pseudobythopirellula maris]